MEGINFKIQRQEATGKVNCMVEEVDIKIDTTEDIHMKVRTQIEEVDLSFEIHKEVDLSFGIHKEGQTDFVDRKEEHNWIYFKDKS